jgi:hypothetical protein
MAAAGWILPFWVGSAPGNAGGGLARALGALTGLPGNAAAVVAATALIAVVQALAGYFLASLITLRRPDDQSQ